MTYKYVRAFERGKEESKSVESFVLGDHQKRAIAYLCKHPYSLLAMATGT